MAKQTVNIGDTGEQLVNKLGNNFNELYADKHMHSNKDILDQIDRLPIDGEPGDTLNAWQNWQALNPAQNILSFNDWIGQHLQNYPFPSEDIERMKARLAWDSAEIGVEYWTGKMEGNKKIYGKIINFGTFPSSGTKTVPHNISNVQRWMHAKHILNNDVSPPWGIVKSNAITSIDLMTDGNIRVITSGPFATNYLARIILLYTCTDR